MKISAAETSSIEQERYSPYRAVMRVWASWQTLQDRREPGGNANLQDVKEFMRCGEAVEVMINDLPRIQWWAVRKAHGVSPAAWRFPNADYLAVLAEAEEVLTPKMRKHIDTGRYFLLE